MAAHSIKVVHARTSGEVDDEMGRTVRQDFVLDDSYKLYQLLGGLAIDIIILKSTESRGFSNVRVQCIKMINIPCRYSPFLDDFALPWLAIHDSLLGFFRLDSDDYSSGTA